MVEADFGREQHVGGPLGNTSRSGQAEHVGGSLGNTSRSSQTEHIGGPLGNSSERATTGRTRVTSPNPGGTNR